MFNNTSPLGFFLFFLSASKARELSVLSDVDGGRGDDAHSESSSSIPAPGKRTPYQFLKHWHLLHLLLAFLRLDQPFERD
jgi:hypothetical protein